MRVLQDPSQKVGSALADERVDFLREQAVCVLRVKTDKWNRFIGAEENQRVLLEFLDHTWTDRLLLFTGPGGTLHAGDAQVRDTRTIQNNTQAEPQSKRQMHTHTYRITLKKYYLKTHSGKADVPASQDWISKRFCRNAFSTTNIFLRTKYKLP